MANRRALTAASCGILRAPRGTRSIPHLCRESTSFSYHGRPHRRPMKGRRRPAFLAGRQADLAGHRADGNQRGGDGERAPCAACPRLRLPVLAGSESARTSQERDGRWLYGCAQPWRPGHDRRRGEGACRRPPGPGRARRPLPALVGGPAARSPAWPTRRTRRARQQCTGRRTGWSRTRSTRSPREPDLQVPGSATAGADASGRRPLPWVSIKADVC